MHQNPELSYKEFNTTKFIDNTLKSWGVQFYHFSNLSTGGYCSIGQGETLVFRADIDALPIEENNEYKYCSKNQGIMHACGHDFHMTIALGILKFFKLNPEMLKGRLLVLFQPGEEALPGGAEKVVKEHIWDNVKSILSVHVNPNCPVGKVEIRREVACANSTSVHIQLHGPGGHTSKPHETVDLINVVGQLTTQLPIFLRQNIDSREPLVFTFGEIKGGESHNIIPNTILLRGTLRTLNTITRNRSIEILKKFTIDFSKLYGIKIYLEFPTFCPQVENDGELLNKFISYMKTTGKISDIVYLPYPSMGADDFAFYLEKSPGLYLQIGAAGSGTLHSSKLMLNEDLIIYSLNTLVGFISCFF